ncbi:MAG: tetraacyldisaccharide 4'-kinase [Flavobacteriaceae bacterium]|nr:tetraacyldisaccharide 4'-kinase [Flavobacteriaceae bacterium]
MSKIRKILYPLSVLYGEITKIRNKMYDKGVLKSTQFEVPVIVVGNLSVGGTGKTPQIEYLIRLLKKDYKIAVLSRGYKRKSKGFLIADVSSDAQQIGDEPFQYYQKFENIIVAVDADRVNGINQLKGLENSPEIILLDDAFQHRKVDAGFNILLTPYNDLYVDDTMLPTGNLRERVEGAERAQIIIVTKCPKELSEEKQFEVASKLNPTLYQTVFFSTIDYSTVVKDKKEEISLENLKEYQVVLVTGIANPMPLKKYLESKNIQFEHLKYPDHYEFSGKDIHKIKSIFDKISSNKKMILTTEKDFVRLDNLLNSKFLEIKTAFINHGQDFDKKIINYVEQSSRNS